MANHFTIPTHFFFYSHMPKRIFIFLIGKQRELQKDMPKEKFNQFPDYSTINRRINRLDIKVLDDGGKELQDDHIITAIDSTGIKVTNRGQWMNEKWKVRKGYLKIHLLLV